MSSSRNSTGARIQDDKTTTDKAPHESTAETSDATAKTTATRVTNDGNNLHVNTEVPAHAANSQTNVSFVDVNGERKILPFDEYVTYATENGL